MRALLMRVRLTRVSLALLSATFLLGCQDLGTGVEAPDGLVPQFGKGNGKGKGKGGGGGDVAGFLTLTDGMATATDLPVLLSGSYAAQNNDFDQPIVMNFPYVFENCEIIRGIGGVHHAEEIEDEYANLLLY